MATTKKFATQTLLPDFTINQWGGLNTAEKNTDNIAKGVSPDALNWITGAAEHQGKYYGDHIELRRGTYFLDGTDIGVSTPISGLGVGVKQDGTQILYFSYGQKLNYFNSAGNAYVEVSTDLFPSGAANDDIAIVPFQCSTIPSSTGSFIIVSSPNSSMYWIDLGTPDTANDLSATEYRGYISVSQGRILLWNRKGATSQNYTDLFMSQADTVANPIVTNPNFVPDATPVATSPSVFSQSGFGNMQNVVSFSGIYFCFHNFGTYQIATSNNDTTLASQSVYRQNAGIPYWRSAYPTGDGVPFLDTLNSSNPKLRLLTLDLSVSGANPAIIPQSISDQLDLTNNFFDRAVVYEWGDYYILACKGITNGVADSINDAMFIYNKKTGFFDKLDYRGTCFVNYYGALISGDSISANPLVLFSGFDDLGFDIRNYWKSAPNTLGQVGMKRFNRLVVTGLIAPSQNLDIYLSYDEGSFVKLGTITGSAYSSGQSVEVGGQTIGSTIVGGGGVVSAYPFEYEFDVGSDIFNRLAIQFQANSIGYVEVDEFTFKDIRFKSRRILASLSE